MNLPNIITMLRILLIPVFIAFMFVGQVGYTIAAFVIFVVASLTDFVDGYIARKYQLVTNFGKLIDPLADKLVVSCALIALVQMSQIHSWIAMVIIAREFLVTTLRIVAIEQGYVMAADRVGKLKTFIQLVAIGALIFDNITVVAVYGVAFSTVAIYAALILTVYSGFHYCFKNRKLFVS